LSEESQFLMQHNNARVAWELGKQEGLLRAKDAELFGVLHEAAQYLEFYKSEEGSHPFRETPKRVLKLGVRLRAIDSLSYETKENGRHG
jgi:hypothetical protein